MEGKEEGCDGGWSGGHAEPGDTDGDDSHGDSWVKENVGGVETPAGQATKLNI